MFRYASMAALAIVLIAFVLPFGTVGCDEEQVRVTGLELASFRVPGAARDEGGEPNLAQEVESRGSLVAVLALVSAAAALVLAAAGKGGWGLLSGVGLVALLWLPVRAGLDLADVWVHEGFVLAVAGLTVAGCARRRRPSGAQADEAWYRRRFLPGLVSRRAADRVRQDRVRQARAARQTGSPPVLRHEGRWQHAAQANAKRVGRVGPDVVSGRALDCAHETSVTRLIQCSGPLRDVQRRRRRAQADQRLHEFIAGVATEISFVIRAFAPLPPLLD